jgi:nucleotide-binding universal stress UspA family protein
MITPLTIIAATNYSDTARNAVTYAAGIAQAANAKLVLFNSFSLNVHSANALISAEEMQKELDRAILRLETLGKEIAHLFKIEVQCCCSYSFLKDELAAVLESTGAELVVMGMAERSFEQDLQGNTTTSVIKNIDIPVLAVPLNARFKKLRKVLYACDTLSFSAARRFSWIIKVIGNPDIEIELFSGEESVAEIRKRDEAAVRDGTLGKEFEDVKYIYKTVRSNAVINEIEKEIKRYQADILVMVPKKYGFWDSLVHKSKTRIMASGLDVPLLSFPQY